jgi:hypothetical protein
MFKYFLIVWIMMAGSPPIKLEDTPVADLAECQRAVTETLDKSVTFLGEHKDFLGFQATCMVEPVPGQNL